MNLSWVNKTIATSVTLVGLAATSALAHNHSGDVAKNVAYVTSQKGVIDVFSLETFERLREIDPGKGGRGMGITDDGKILVVAVQSTKSVKLLDTVTGELIKEVPVGINPEFVRVYGNLAFVAYEPSAKGGPPPKPGTKAYEEAKKEDDDDEEPARVAIIDIAKGEKIREIVVGRETEGIELAANGKEIIVTNEADDNLSVHNIETGETVKVIDTKEYGIRPRGVKISPDGKEFAVTLEFGNKLLILDDKYNVIAQAPTGKVPYGVTYSRDGSKIYVALAYGKKIQVFDRKTMKPIQEMATGTRCWHFSFTPDDARLVVACGRSDEVLVIDAKTGETLKSIEDKNMPWGVIVYPKSVGSLDMPN